MWKAWKEKKVFVNHLAGTNEVEVVSFPANWGKPTTEERDQWKISLDLSKFNEAEIINVFDQAPFIMTFEQLKSAYQMVDGLTFIEQAAGLLYLREHHEQVTGDQKLERGI